MKKQAPTPAQVAAQLEDLVRQTSVQMTAEAGEYTRFTPKSFAGIIGTEVPCYLPGGRVRTVTVERVDVDEDGTRAYITIKGDLGDVVGVTNLEHFSIGGLQ